MAIHLVRHAKAGVRPGWRGDDEERPLTDAGRTQADVIADLLAGRGVRRVLTSRYLRCVQTVEPLAARLGVPVEHERALAEEADPHDAWRLVEDLAAKGEEAVLCSHGNIVSPILDRLHRRGLEVVATEWTCAKGSVWTIEVDDDGEPCRVVQTLRQA